MGLQVFEAAARMWNRTPARGAEGTVRRRAVVPAGGAAAGPEEVP
jgi:hypothetical protein